jgi:DNA-binding phage protein
LIGGVTMPLTRSFKETIQARVRRDAAFRKALLRESVESFLVGDLETGKAALRDYINATMGFGELAEVTHHSAKSLMRMLSPSGNPQARNLFEIVEYLQRKEKVHFEVVVVVRRGLAQARKGEGRPADQVFESLEREDASWSSLRGALKEVLTEKGGGEAYLRAERRNFHLKKERG